MPSAIIIDDSPIMRAQLRNVLTGAGFTISAEAGNANDLEALYDRHHPDLISLDIVMPGRDGATAATELLARRPQAVIVMCTSLASREKIMACQKAGVSYYLLKPFNPEHAASIFKCAIERPRAAAAAR
jgi:DNA-binding NarL/FixJ family response regulator|nr:response regulator [Kofleriaceae bacterium]